MIASMPMKKKSVRKTAGESTARKRTTSASRSFRGFARKLQPANPPLKMFKTYALAEDFPAGESWQEVRGFLIRNGAEHEAVVGARIAWREFRSKSS